MNDCEFTILMPCLNEEKTVAYCIEEAKRFISENSISAEILIADNGSTDSSPKIAAEHGARVVTVPEKGYGNALIGGIKAAKGKYIIMGDCDKSYDFYRLSGFVTKLREGFPLVMGNRFAGGIEEGAMPFSHKYLGVPLLSLFGRIRFKTDVYDFHCGIRGFDRKAALALNLSCGGMEFATEIIAKFALSGVGIAQIPVPLRKDGRNGKSHLRSIPDGLRHLRFILFYDRFTI
ncbi:MAG: glycosyltransferase family 2 protein [Oscillospiraceae bacterium]|nr:glycosyltransferase family 2 protein [Oscillospiraceae bacterium]